MFFYKEFKTTVANLNADLNTQLGAATDWSRPNSTARPNTWKCTTTRGAQMVVDFADQAILVYQMYVGVYDSYDGTTLGNKRSGVIRWKETGSGTAAANVLYVTLSAWKEGLFISIEGPRAGEANNDNSTYGSIKKFFLITDLTPYYDSTLDPTPCVITYLDQGSATWASTAYFDHKVRCSKTVDGTQFWTMGMLHTPSEIAGPSICNRIGLDGKFITTPYIYFDDRDGYRGRLTNIFFCGWNVNQGDFLLLPQAVPGSTIVQDGVRYKVVTIYKNNGNNNGGLVGPLGWTGTNQSGGGNMYHTQSPLIAIPMAAA